MDRFYAQSHRRHPHILPQVAAASSAVSRFKNPNQYWYRLVLTGRSVFVSRALHRDSPLIRREFCRGQTPQYTFEIFASLAGRRTLHLLTRFLGCVGCLFRPRNDANAYTTPVLFLHQRSVIPAPPNSTPRRNVGLRRWQGSLNQSGARMLESPLAGGDGTLLIETTCVAPKRR